jgi:hypothetical protein
MPHRDHFRHVDHGDRLDFLNMPDVLKRDTNNKAPFMIIESVVGGTTGLFKEPWMRGEPGTDTPMPVQWPDPRLNPSSSPPAKDQEWLPPWTPKS